MHVPGQRYKAKDRCEAAAIAIQRTFRKFACRVRYLELLAKRQAGREMLRHWHFHMIRRKTHELAQIERGIHREVSIELHQRFRASWNEIKTKPRQVYELRHLYGHY